MRQWSVKAGKSYIFRVGPDEVTESSFVWYLLVPVNQSYLVQAPYIRGQSAVYTQYLNTNINILAGLYNLKFVFSRLDEFNVFMYSLFFPPGGG